MAWHFIPPCYHTGMRKYIGMAGLGLAVALALAAPLAKAAEGPKLFEGTVTQIDPGDQSFILRLRDGSTVRVKNPVITDIFIAIKGILKNGTVEQVTSLAVRDPKSPDLPPQISLLNPASGQIGETVTLSGTFLKKNNSVRWGGTSNAVTGLASKDGKTLAFKVPSSLCDQKARITGCGGKVTPPGKYDLSVQNANGLSNSVPFEVLPLPQLDITTDILPQAMTGVFYRNKIEAVGGAESYSWRVSQGNLPPGFSFARAACTETPCRTAAILAGLPYVPGTYNFTVTLTSGAESISREFSLVVVQALNPRIY